MKEDSKRWAQLLDDNRNLEFEQNNKAEIFERERIENIKQRYANLKEALECNYAKDSTLKDIALLGAEFEAKKATQYFGGEPF